MGCSKSSSKREVNSNTIQPQEIRKTLNIQPNFIPKQLEKEEQKTQNQQKERNKDLSRNKWGEKEKNNKDQ